ncbi:unnamed protein product [Kuraishia capsulata CBS 1993]|uniref:CMP/dCMP-type deaminase domain-containing protein n=1 Tax=Kuraishia capsulata CBS 1993 TaxID=1382522 RepID=W6MRJ2_9ASCO|nr:uncharacterized protein KUCA_T00005317001 [Kuraishia capsulata CBS 1993]CDK29329.1 unnamed protein product [Kuraishia capsulata CBS 1993]
MEQLSTHFRFMRKALEVGQKALDEKEVPVGCVFVHRGKVIAEGSNKTNETLCGTRHAEFEGISQIVSTNPNSYKDILKETDLYVTVEPCIMCASALRQLQIKRVFFGCGNDRFGGNGSVLSLQIDQAEVESFPRGYCCYPGILNREAVMLLRKFYLLENDSAPQPTTKKTRNLIEDEFPRIEYKNYLTRNQFVEMFGEGRVGIYDSGGDGFIEESS